MKRLIIVTHPNLSASNINKNWLEELAKHGDAFEVHALYEKYPDLNFDIQTEQKLLESFQEIIFQFPLHWFSTPFALKKYFDDVLTYGWAFGPGGDKLKGKKIGFAVSTGGAEESYTPPKGVALDDLLNDVKLTFTYCGCEITKIHAFHGAMFAPEPTKISENAKAYISDFTA